MNILKKKCKTHSLKCVFECFCVSVCTCAQLTFQAACCGPLLLVRLIKVRLQDSSFSSSTQMDRRKAIIFLGVWRGVSVYITQRISLKSCSSSILNSGLISSLPSCWHARRPLNGHSGCYGRLGLSYLLLPDGILVRS